jgi:hypothetical protein
VVLAGLGLWWLLPHAPTERAAPTPFLASLAPEPGTPAERDVSAVREGGTDAGSGALLLRATLRGERAFSGEARVGVAFISEADRIAWEEAQRESSSGAGPRRLEDLANVAEWLPAPVIPELRGGGTLGPVPVPVAHRYRLLAWEPDGTFYWGELVPQGLPRAGVLDAGELRAIRPTGLRVRLTGKSPTQVPGRYFLSIERVVDPADAERASELLPVVRHLAPALASALQEGTLLPLVPEEESVLLPLPPDQAMRLRVRASSGLESEPWEVPLREGRVEEVVLELSRLFPEGEQGLVELRGRLLLGNSERPLPGVWLEHVEPPGTSMESGPDGRFVAPGLPSWRSSRFAALLAPTASGRPMAPRRWEFEFTPDGRAREAEVTWRVPVYRWLTLRMDSFTRGQLEMRARRPYPVFLLQRWSEEGTWRVQSAEQFLHEEEGVAVSLFQPGTYRVLAAVSPYEIYESERVELVEGDGERSAVLKMDEHAMPCEVHVSSGATGRPVYGALVTAAGGHGSLPPVRGRTDVEGRWSLGGVRAPALYLEVQREGIGSWAGESTGDCQRSGVIDVRL